MKKLVSVLVLGMFLISACTPTLTPTAAPTPAPALTALPTQQPTPLKQTEITWLVRVNDTEQKWEIDTILPNFQRTNPAIKVNLVAIPAADFDRRLQAMIAAGAPPDVWSPWGTTGFMEYVKRGLAADLTPLVAGDKFDLSDFQPEILNLLKVDGQLMGLPVASTGSYLFYNKDLFDKAGIKVPTPNWDDKTWTWDAFVQTCKALTSLKNDPKNDVYGCNLDLQPNEAYPWLWGLDIFPDSAYQTGFAQKSNLADPKISAVYQARQDLIWKNKVMPDPATTNSSSFKDGHMAMTLAAGQAWWNFSDIKDFKWGAAALPFGADGRRDVLFTDAWLMSAQSAHPQEAWTFMKYLASAQIQDSWLKVVNTAPVRISLADKWYAQFPNMKPEEVKQVFLGAFKYGRESPSHLLVKYDALNQIITTALKPVYNNQLKASDAIPPSAKTLDDALAQIQKDFKK